ncbi:unnamed protein product [Urochloa humidicola]
MASPPANPPRLTEIENSEDERKAFLPARSTVGSGGGSSSDSGSSNGNGNGNGIGNKLYASCISNTSNIMVMGILTLNIYSASYFLAWRKDGSVCHIFPRTASAPVSSNSPDSAVSDKNATTFIQLVVVSLPFTGLALTVGIGFLAKMSKEAVQYLGCAAGLVATEIVYIIALGGVMTACMSSVSGPSVGFVTLGLLSLLLLMWGYCCFHPKCLRSGVFCKCCCPDVDLVQLEAV